MSGWARYSFSSGLVVLDMILDLEGNPHRFGLRDGFRRIRQVRKQRSDDGQAVAFNAGPGYQSGESRVWDKRVHIDKGMWRAVRSSGGVRSYGVKSPSPRSSARHSSRERSCATSHHWGVWRKYAKLRLRRNYRFYLWRSCPGSGPVPLRMAS